MSNLSKSQKRNLRRSRLKAEHRDHLEEEGIMSEEEEGEAENVLEAQGEDVSKKARMRSNVIEEIVQSEARYLEDLYTMRLYYVLPLRQGRFPEVNNNNTGDIMMLFSTIDLIFEGNTELLNKLQKETKKKEPYMIGKIFLEMADQICQYYGVFCNHQKEAMDSISNIAQTSTIIKSFLDVCKQKPETGGLGLLDFLVKPFQRLLKYPLLLRELQKYTPDDHPDKENLTNALNKLSEEVDVINTNKFKNDNMKKMLEISQNVDSLPRHFKIMVPTRVFIFEGTLMKISGKHNQERHFILFNDSLMYCKKRGAGKYQCKGIIFLTKLKVEDMNDQVSFRIHRSDKDLTYILYGKGQQEKETWLHQIGQQLQKLNPSSKSLSIRTPGEAKEVVRVYVGSNQTFKTFAISSDTSVAELCDKCSKKIRTDSTANTPFVLWLVLNGKSERTLESFEKPLEVQAALGKRGVKMNTDSNHFKIVFEEDVSSVEPPLLTRHSSPTLNAASLSPLQRTSSVSVVTDTGLERKPLRPVLPAPLPPSQAPAATVTSRSVTITQPPQRPNSPRSYQPTLLIPTSQSAIQQAPKPPTSKPPPPSTPRPANLQPPPPSTPRPANLQPKIVSNPPMKAAPPPPSPVQQGNANGQLLRGPSPENLHLSVYSGRPIPKRPLPPRPVTNYET